MKVLKYLITIIILILLYNLSLYSISLIPSDWIYENSYSSASTLFEEGAVFKLSSFNVIDTAADALVINQSYSIDSNYPLESYLKMRKNYKVGLTKVELADCSGDLMSYYGNRFDDNDNPISDPHYDPIIELYKFMQGNVNTSVNYARYYHGYMFFYRPLLLITNITGIRVIQLIAFIILFALMAYLLYKKFDKYVTFSICISFIISGYFYVSYSLQQAPIYWLIMISSILLLIRIENVKWSTIFYASLIVGSLTCFLDFLTCPALTLAIPLLIYSLYYCKNNKIDNKKLIINVIKTGIIWLLGYTITWFSKWIICDLLTDTSIIENAINQVLYRSGIMVGFLVNRVMTLLIRLAYNIAIFIIILLVTSFFHKKNAHTELFANHTNTLGILFICLIPVAWFVTIFNHSISHSFFTYRDFSLVYAFIILLFYKKVSFKNDCAKKKRKK